MEVNRCIERMEEVEKDVQCITMHPGFGSVCLDRWVLQTAGIGLKTKLKKVLYHYANTWIQSRGRVSFLLCLWH